MQQGRGLVARKIHRVGGLTLALLALGVGILAATGAMAGAAQPSATKLVPGLLTGLSKATFISDAAASQPMTVGLGGRHPNATPESAD